MGKRGPKPKGSTAFTMRLRDDLRAALEQAAARSGKTITEEIHSRLALTFEDPAQTKAEFGGRQPYAIMRRIMETWWKAGLQAYFHRTNRGAADPLEWLSDRYAFDQAVRCATTILEGFRPPGEIVAPEIPTTGKPEFDEALRNIGMSLGRGALIDILQVELDPPPLIGDANARKQVSDDLGPTLRRRLGQPIFDPRFQRKGRKP